MDSQTYINFVRTDGARLHAVARDALDAPVPACPGWDVARVVGHVGQVHGWITQVVSEQSLERPAFLPPAVPEERAELLDWAGKRLDGITDALVATDPEAPCWNWSETGKAGFFHRRMAHETAMHRWDVEQAADNLTDIDGDLASDGVDELIWVGMQNSTNPESKYTYPEGSLHIHRTDGEGEWLLRGEDGKLVATREHAKGDAAVRGSGQALLLYMWGRDRSDVEILGDTDVAAAWARMAP